MYHCILFLFSNQMIETRKSACIALLLCKSVVVYFLFLDSDSLDSIYNILHGVIIVNLLDILITSPF